MSAIGAGAKELPRQGGRGGATTGRARSDLGDEQAGVHTALSGARGEIRASQEAWPKGVGTLGHPLNRPETAIGGGFGLRGIPPSTLEPKSP
jgi:hypothetical protein